MHLQSPHVSVHCILPNPQRPTDVSSHPDAAAHEGAGLEGGGHDVEEFRRQSVLLAQVEGLRHAARQVDKGVPHVTHVDGTVRAVQSATTWTFRRRRNRFCWEVQLRQHRISSTKGRFTKVGSL